ncbi:RagB/SusD family nutrient uptake outer membrane protein [Maribacter thermophilus]|uniref:RagB/SusD family nutrient uptake outer membrane protein n=1 Tax=Maribacter thermophilus TaxID=1197874 RepID=UPI0006414284|nr:RagB/SusD family nutrient uptake outer membrane protein [Maribacter thermophilus]
MKSTIYIKSLLLVCGLYLASCDNKLDEDAELRSYQNDIDYSSTEGAYGAVVGAYAAFQSVGWEQIPLIAVRGDDVNAGGLGDQQSFADTDNYTYDNNYWMYNSLWENWFQDVMQITSQIEQLELYREGGVSSSLVDQYIAEAMTLRGFITLELSRVFGDVYLIESTDQTSITVESKEYLMQWISDQMDEAIPNLVDLHPNQRTDIPGGMTKYTALAVKAMANLELKNYQAVADATGEIINSGKFELYDDFYQLFKIPGKLCNENILEIQYSDFGQSSGANEAHLFAFYGPQGWTPAVPEAGEGWGFFEPSTKYIKFMLDRGETTRLETSVLFTDRGIADLQTDPDYATLPDFVSNTTRDGDVINDYSRAMFASGKHYLPSIQLTEGRTDYGTNKNYTVIRYAEVLLMYAEALTRGASGTAGSADDAVNLVRARAGMPALSGVTSDDVMDEKFAELAMEWGIRYYDMIRLEETSELSYDGRTFTMEKAYLPYPLEQLDVSPILDEYNNQNN